MELPEEVDVLRLRYDPARRAAWEALLSEEERERLHAFGPAKRKRQFLAGRVAARQLLANALDTTPEQVPLRVSEDGAVDVDGAALFLSLAHSADQAVAVTGPFPIGVDLERVKRRPQGIQRFVLHPEERGLPERLALDDEEALVLCWTLKEAALKARRSGLRVLPNRLRLDVGATPGRATVHVSEAERWSACYQLENGYCLAVAYRRDSQ